jgi:catechol 2,3-dioxygenase-like lactoylglutathione lyase family enzyme
VFDRFSHVLFFVRDMERAIGFYTGTLGFNIRYRGGDGFASLMHEGMGCRLDLHIDTGAEAAIGNGPLAYFLAKDFEAAVAKLKQAGVEVNEPRREGNSPWFTAFKDSEGNWLGLEEARG